MGALGSGPIRMMDQFQTNSFTTTLAGSGSLDINVRATAFFNAELTGSGQTTIAGYDLTPLELCALNVGERPNFLGAQASLLAIDVYQYRVPRGQFPTFLFMNRFG